MRRWNIKITGNELSFFKLLNIEYESDKPLENANLEVYQYSLDISKKNQTIV